MSNLFRNLFGGGRRSGKSQLTQEFINSFTDDINRTHLQRAQEALNNELEQMAVDRGIGQSITGRELLARQAAAVQVRPSLRSNYGMPHIQSISRAQDAFAGLLAHRPGRLDLYEPNRFTRWMDIRESEDELQEFLGKCVKYGEKMQRRTNMSVEDLEGDNNG